MAGAAAEARQLQKRSRILSVAVDLVAVGLHLMPPLRHMVAEAVVIILPHQKQVQALLEAVALLHYLHLKLKAARTTLTVEDSVADLVSALHILEALVHLLQADITPNTISTTKLAEDSTVSLVTMAVEDLHHQEAEFSEDSLKPAAMLLVRRVDSIEDMGSMGEKVSVVVMDSAEVLVM